MRVAGRERGQNSYWTLEKTMVYALEIATLSHKIIIYHGNHNCGSDEDKHAMEDFFGQHFHKAQQCYC